MADAYWNAMVPELTVRDIAVSLAFYRLLGFAVRFQRSEPDFDCRGAGRDLGCEACARPRMEDLGCKACHARTIGGRGRPSDDRRGAVAPQPAAHLR